MGWSAPAIERFKAKIRESDDGCWNWTAYRGKGGYGRFYVDGKNVLVHRWSYQFHVGPIADGLVIDHLCRNTSCVNPDHLEPVTPQVNTVRGIGPQIAAARCAAITHCPAGHEYTEENTYDVGNGRACWTCKRAKRREHYQRNRAAYIARAAKWRAENPERARELGREGTRRYRTKQKAS